MNTITKESYAREKLVKRPEDSNKGDFGKLLMICGSYGMIGAGIMAGRAALRSGIGLLNIVVEKNCYPIMANALPEAVFTVIDFEKKSGSKEKIIAALEGCTACVIGCGLGDSSDFFMPIVLENCQVPLIIDADGINFLSRNIDELGKIKTSVAITPHPGEMSRLIKNSITEIQADRQKIAKEFSEKYKLITVLKGNLTVVATPDCRSFLNPTGNSGMAKAGSGDVLSGIIGSFCAQGMSLEDACVSGVFFHGLAGDIAVKKFSKQSLLPTDIIETLPEIFISGE